MSKGYRKRRQQLKNHTAGRDRHSKAVQHERKAERLEHERGGKRKRPPWMD